MRKLAQHSHENPENLFHIIEYFPIISELVSKRDVIGVANDALATSKSFKSKFRVLPTSLQPALSFRVAYPEASIKSKLIKRFLRGIPTEPTDMWGWQLG